MNAEPPITTVFLRDPDEVIVIGDSEDYIAFDMTSSTIYFTLIGKPIEYDEHVIVRNFFTVPISRIVYVHTERARVVRQKAEPEPPKIDEAAREERRRRYES